METKPLDVNLYEENPSGGLLHQLWKSTGRWVEHAQTCPEDKRIMSENFYFFGRMEGENITYGN